MLERKTTLTSNVARVGRLPRGVVGYGGVETTAIGGYNWVGCRNQGLQLVGCRRQRYLQLRRLEIKSEIEKRSAVSHSPNLWNMESTNSPSSPEFQERIAEVSILPRGTGGRGTVVFIIPPVRKGGGAVNPYLLFPLYMGKKYLNQGSILTPV